MTTQLESQNTPPAPPAAPTNGSKAALGIVGFFAVVAGVYAMVEPMGQRIDFISQEIGSLREQMAGDDRREIDDQARFSQTSERFKEVETQFKGLRELMGVYVTRLDGQVSRLETWRVDWSFRVRALDAAQWERIKTLERAITANHQAVRDGA